MLRLVFLTKHDILQSKSWLRIGGPQKDFTIGQQEAIHYPRLDLEILNHSQ